MTSAVLAEPEALVEPAYKHLPDGYHHTLGPLVAELVGLFGWTPGPEQQEILDWLFAEDDDSHPAVFEAALICPRQNLKTATLMMAAAGWLFLTEQRKIVWSSQDFPTTKSMCRELDNLLRSSDYLAAQLLPTRWAAQDMCIETIHGQRIEFKARTKDSGRGLTGDKVILDESYALKEEHVGAIVPILGPRRDSQIIYASSAGMADSDALRQVRDRGRNGSTPDMAYFEWCSIPGQCADPYCQHIKPGMRGHVAGCQMDDRAEWKKANPVMNRARRKNGTGQTELDFARDRQSMSPAQFGRERLGWWDEPGLDEAFGPGNWEACAGEVPSSLTLGALGIAVSFDGQFTAIVGAARHEGRMVVKPLAHGLGQEWLVDEVAAILAKSKVPVIIDNQGPAAHLVDDLQKVARKNLHAIATKQYGDACAGIFNLVVNHELLHGDWQDLNQSVIGANKRPMQDRWAWGRRISNVDISELEGATLAAWGADHCKPRRSIYTT